MGKKGKAAAIVIQIFLLALVFCLINMAFFNYIEANLIAEQSGERFAERDEYQFSEPLQSESDYIEQGFRPKHPGLESINIRLAVNYLEDDFALQIELWEDGRMLQSEEIRKEQIVNWKYYSFSVGHKLSTERDYLIRFRKTAGAEKSETGEKQNIFALFQAAVHVEENKPHYYHRGVQEEGEIEVYYLYAYRDRELITCQTAVNILFVICIGILLLVKKHIKASEKIQKRIGMVLYFCLPPASFLIVEAIAGNLDTIMGVNVLKNILIYYAVFILFSLIIRNLKVLAAVYLTGFSAVGLVYYFVMTFRGRVFTVQDIFALRTAAVVAGKYVYAVTYPVYVILMIALLLACICMLVNIRVFTEGRKAVFLVCVCGLICITGVGTGRYLSPLTMWDLESNYQRGGIVLTLVSEMQYVFTKKPDGYSREKVVELLEEAQGIEVKAQPITPDNIILIMNESFADLEYIGEIDTDAELLPFIHGLNENVIKGYVDVAEFGGGTSNSEYEVLTGNAMEFLPKGSYAYQLNVFEKEYGMASTLKAQGYETLAMHPFTAESWNRNNVYPYMGFDEYMAVDDFGEIEMIRWSASDSFAFRKVIERCEQAEGKFFNFLVTIQNHGGYMEEWENFENTVELKYDEKYPDVEQYLSLLQESDRALEELVEYFSESEEPTMIVMFGDHQVGLDEKFYEELFGKPMDELTLEEEQKKYVTPFVIWTNYDIEEEYGVRMSANYFGSYILEKGGAKLPPYNRFLLKLREEIPVISRRGICDKDGVWYQWDGIPEKYAALIEEYEMIQYNNVVDRKNRVDAFFEVE